MVGEVLPEKLLYRFWESRKCVLHQWLAKCCLLPVGVWGVGSPDRAEEVT